MSIDETSFWQFLFVLSSAMKAGEGTPAQLVVKLHYVLNKADYKDCADIKSCSENPSITAPVDLAVCASAPNTGSELTTAPAATAMEIEQSDLTMDGRTENSTILSGSMVFEASESTTFPAEDVLQESDIVKVETVLASPPQEVTRAVQRFRCKAEAIQDFNQFLPVMVGRM